MIFLKNLISIYFNQKISHHFPEASPDALKACVQCIKNILYVNLSTFHHVLLKYLDHEYKLRENFVVELFSAKNSMLSF